MTPERLAEIEANRNELWYSGPDPIPELTQAVKQLQAELANLAYSSGETADQIFRYEDKIEKLQAELATAKNHIVRLLGENRELKAELRGRE